MKEVRSEVYPLEMRLLNSIPILKTIQSKTKNSIFDYIMGNLWLVVGNPIYTQLEDAFSIRLLQLYNF